MRNARVHTTARYFWIAPLWGVVFTVVSYIAQQSMEGTESSHTTVLAASPVEIPFRLYRDYLIVVQGTVEGPEKMNLLIDTGADPSVLDRRVARKLRLRGVSGRLGLLNHTVDVEQVVLPSLRLGPLRAES